MSAARITEAPAGRTTLRFPRPPEGLSMPIGHAYRAGDQRVPVPFGLRRYVRGDAHFALVLGTIAKRMGTGRYSGARREACLALLRIMAVNLYDPRASALILLLMPPTDCPVCGREFMGNSRHRLMCSDACRRRVAREKRSKA